MYSRTKRSPVKSVIDRPLASRELNLCECRRIVPRFSKKAGASVHGTLELITTASPTTTATCRSILTMFVNTLQNPSRRHPQFAMGPARAVAQERIAPMHVWERIIVRRLVRRVIPCGVLRHTRLLLHPRQTSGVVDFLVFWQIGCSKTLQSVIQSREREVRGSTLQ
jgi:hypothetical protein